MEINESIALVTACRAASGVLVAIMGWPPCERILPSLSTSPTATFVPPISTPRNGPLSLEAAVMVLASLPFGAAGELNLDDFDLVRLGLQPNFAIVQCRVAHWFFHKISVHCRLRSRRKL